MNLESKGKVIRQRLVTIFSTSQKTQFFHSGWGLTVGDFPFRPTLHVDAEPVPVIHGTDNLEILSYQFNK